MFIGPGLLGRIVRRVPRDEPNVFGLVLLGPDVQRNAVRLLLRNELLRRRRPTLLLRRALQQRLQLRALFESRVQRRPALRRRDVQRDRDVLDVRERLPLRDRADVLERLVRGLSHREPNVHGQLLLGAQLQRDSVRVLLRIERVRRLWAAVLLQRSLQRGALVRRLCEPRVSLSDHSQSTFAPLRRER